MNRILSALPGANEKPAGQNEKEIKEAAARKRSALVGKIVQFLNVSAPRTSAGVIFDSSGQSLNTTPVIVAARELPDLTNEVIKGDRAESRRRATKHKNAGYYRRALLLLCGEEQIRRVISRIAHRIS